MCVGMPPLVPGKAQMNFNTGRAGLTHPIPTLGFFRCCETGPPWNKMKRGGLARDGFFYDLETSPHPPPPNNKVNQRKPNKVNMKENLTKKT